MAKKKKTVTETAKPKQRRRCFICNGTGEMCDCCGESVDVCDCGDGPSNRECENCGGIGIAVLDQTPEELWRGKVFRSEDKED